MRIKYIDVLKAFAILAVVLYHSGISVYGFLGVDLFLVIAGYLTTKGLYKKMITPEITSNVGHLYIDFEVNRIFRLLPPLLVAGLVCMLFGYYAMLPDDYENLGESVIATNFFVNNFLSAITTKDYWAISNNYRPLMHTWYVGLVMQFYIVYPVLFLLAKLGRKNFRGSLLTLLVTLSFLSFLTYFATTNDAHRFYYLPSRFFEFMVGGIIALIYKPKENTPFPKWYVYFCYLLLIILIFLNSDVIPSSIRLVAVVALSGVLLCSQNILENKITGNSFFAKIGAASYSIFIWHQILLAFYRYTITNEFTLGSYAILVIGTIVLSWLSYNLIETPITKVLKSKQHKVVLFISVAMFFLALNAYAGYIYLKAGVVRDVPELYISKNNIHRGMHAEYCDRVYAYDKPFETDKPHWLVIGNSFGRDFVNMILESDIKDKVEVSYIYHTDYNKKENIQRYAKADRVFISTFGLTEEYVSSIEMICHSNGFPTEKLVIVGEKNFGESNGQFYFRRNTSYYFQQRTKADKKMVEKNNYFRTLYGDRFLDLLSMVIDDEGKVPVFSPDHHYISQDCKHFSKGGALFFGELVDWDKLLK